MITDMEKRPYRLKKRAESRDATRARIVEALMQLHEEVGPRNTTISAVAERAGVQRLTVYRHFPDEAELLNACTSRWLELNPPPDPQAWAGVADPVERCRAALTALYEYFHATERMWSVSHRDESEVEALKGPMNAFRAYLAQITSGLLEPFRPPASVRKALSVTLAHLVGFPTWASLRDGGLDPAEAADLGCAWVAAAAGGRGSRPSDRA